MEAGHNSVWLLPNRIYEGGYYATPSIAPAGTETAQWINRNVCGFVIDEPLSETLPNLISTLLEDRSPIDSYRARLVELPEELFIQPKGYMRDMISRILSVENAA